MIVADTDELIDYLNGQGQADEMTALLGVGALWTTVISRFELLNGARTAKQRKPCRTSSTPSPLWLWIRRARTRPAGLEELWKNRETPS